MQKVYAYIIAFILVLATSLSGQYFTSQSVKSDWYKCISPKITPPSIVFPIVWTILYILIIIALARAFIKNSNTIVLLFVINLLFNVIWCYVYFGLRNPMASIPPLIVIIITAIYIATLSYTTDRAITYLLIPYILWTLFALLLNSLSLKKCKI